MELRISKTRHPIPLLLLFSFFFSQFFPATPQTLSIGFHYRSSTRSPPVSSPTTTIAKSPPVSSPTTTTAKSPPGSSPTTTTAKSPPVSSPTTTTAKSPPVSSPTTTTAKSPPGSSPTTTTAKSPPGSSPTTTTAKSPAGSSPTTTTAKSPSTSSPTTTTAESPPVTPSQSTVVFNATRKRRPNRAKAEFLNAHNAVRRRVGEPLFEWNWRLAAYAGAWAKKRVGDCRLVHSNGPFGENIFWGGNTKWRPRDVVRIWAEENKYYDEKANACEPDQMCGHYTQIVWRESTKVGCAREECSNGGVYVICVYNPPGNYEGENPFGQYTDKSGVDRNDPPATVAQPLV